MSEGVRRRAEDTAAGCRDRATKDRLLAADEPNARMRDRLESSAVAWSTRANLLERLESGQRGDVP